MARNNNSAIDRKMSKFLREQVHRDMTNKLEAICDNIALHLEDNPVPIATSNLLDSTGLAAYHNGVMLRYVPRKMAVVPHEETGKWGHDELGKAIEKGASKGKRNYVLSVYSAMPYAPDVNSEGGHNPDHYFDKIVDEVDRVVRATLKSKRKTRRK